MGIGENDGFNKYEDIIGKMTNVTARIKKENAKFSFSLLAGGSKDD